MTQAEASAFLGQRKSRQPLVEIAFLACTSAVVGAVAVETSAAACAVAAVAAARCCC